MDLVLGLSMTSTAVRWVLVEGTTGEGATIHRDGIDFDTLDDVIAAVGDNRLHAVGVTWTIEAEAEASTMLDALADRGLENVITISELEAADVLAAGIADRAGYDDVAVCLVEPDAAVIAKVSPAGVSVDRIARPLDGADAVELPSSVIAMLDLDEWQPEAIFVVGSADDLDLVMSTLAGLTESPVYSAAEADLALARGAALASARAVNTLEAPRAPLMSRTAALASVLVAAVVVFVVSLSVALGMRLAAGTDSTPEQRPAADAADAPAPAAPAPSVPKASPKVPRPAAPPPPPPAAPPPKRTVAAAVPPAPEVAPIAEPVNEPPAAAPMAPAPAYVPPAPVYTPPAPAYTPPAPAYVPPAPPPNYVPPAPPQPRLRDRIIERIPIINRFHEPELQYPYN
jgi:hypothetical protein